MPPYHCAFKEICGGVLCLRTEEWELGYMISAGLELCAHFYVSRPTVRSALAMLVNFESVEADRLKITPLSTNGAEKAVIHEVRVYQ